jgi:putative cell wall-binding protein
VIIATGYNFADSLSVSPLSYAFNAPIVLTQQNGTLTQAALDAIASNQYITNAIIVGGAAAVNGAVEGQLNGIGVTPQRIQGATRYETSKNIADFEVRNFNFDWERPIVATGTNFPDALAGAPLAGLNGSVMLLANNTNDATVTALASNKSVVRAGQFYYVLGGTAAVSNNLVTFIDNVLS